MIRGCRGRSQLRHGGSHVRLADPLLQRQKIPRAPSTSISYSLMPFTRCAPSISAGIASDTGTRDTEVAAGVVELVPVAGAESASVHTLFFFFTQHSELECAWHGMPIDL
jgi:hypothetical protein